MFSDFEDGGEMWTGSGPREARKRIEFSEAFRNPPAVQASLAMIDMSNETNARIDVQAQNVDATSFDLVFRTWGDSRVARTRVDWTAIGEIGHDDDWDIPD